MDDIEVVNLEINAERTFCLFTVSIDGGDLTVKSSAHLEEFLLKGKLTPQIANWRSFNMGFRCQCERDEVLNLFRLNLNRALEAFGKDTRCPPP